MRVKCQASLKIRLSRGGKKSPTKERSVYRRAVSLGPLPSSHARRSDNLLLLHHLPYVLFPQFTSSPPKSTALTRHHVNVTISLEFLHNLLALPFPLRLSLPGIGLPQGRDYLFVQRLRQGRRHRVANLLADSLVCKFKVHGKGLQACDLSAGKTAQARGVIVALASTASQRLCWLATIKRCTKLPAPFLQPGSDIVVRCIIGDIRDRIIDGHYRQAATSGQVVGDFGERREGLARTIRQSENLKQGKIY